MSNNQDNGNAAAMRKALEYVIQWREDCISEEGADNVDDMIAIVQTALAAPARNCDLPLVVDGPADNNADKAWLVFKQHNPYAYFDVSGLLRCIDWLLAPAAEQKGEGDGQEV